MFGIQARKTPSVYIPNIFIGTHSAEGVSLLVFDGLIYIGILFLMYRKA